LDLFEVSLDALWLELASTLTVKTLDLFYDQRSGMFNYNAAGSDCIQRGLLSGINFYKSYSK